MKQPHPYQIVGATFMANDGMLLADEAGLGKTIQAIEACKLLNAKRVLVICPAVALGVWRDEVAACWPEMAPIFVREAIVDQSQFALATHAGLGVVLITGYEFLLRNARAQDLIAYLKHFDVLILDEAHRLKNPTAQITMLVYGPGCAGGGLVGMADQTRLLTATPQLNHSGEWFPHVRALAPERIEQRSYDGFTDRFCTFKTRTVRTKSGRSKNIEVIDGSNRATIPELAHRLRGFWLRRKISDVRGELPPLMVTTRSIEPEVCDAKWLVEAEDSEEAKLLRKALEKGNLEALSDVEVQVSRLRRLLATAKIPATVAVVEDLLEQGVGKVAVWGWHVEPLHEIAGALAAHGSTIITGATTRRELVAREFQTDPERRVFVGQIMAAGTAIDLDAADRVVFTECAWTPALNYQAMMRHRRAAKENIKPLLVEILAVRGSIDYAVQEILSRKAADITMLEDAS